MNNVQEADRRFVSVWTTLEPYIDTVCAGFGRRFQYIDGDDLKQECAIKLLTILREKELKFTETELIYFFKKTVFNLLRDFDRARRRSITVPDKELTGSLYTELALDGEFSAFEFLLFKQYCHILKRALGSQLEVQVFELMLKPEKAIVDLAIRDYEKRKVRVTGIDFQGEEVKIFNYHYAEHLQVSPATISRVLKKIVAAGRKVLIRYGGIAP